MSPPQFAPAEPVEKPWYKTLFGPIVVVGVLLLKFGAKLKFLLIPLLKFFPVVLKTGGTMLLSIGVYAQSWGWKFAVGFVVLLLVHECGHLLAAKKLGLNVGAPVFIPFMGAFIALKDAPKDAWVEAQVGIGGPMLGTLGAGLCYAAYVVTDEPFLAALAYTGFFLNLFNLAPVGFLDGGRIVTALSPWLWVVGFAVIVAMVFHHPNPLLILILVFSLPRLFSLFRQKSDAEKRFYEVTPSQRWQMAVMYFGLIILLFVGMMAAHLQPAGQ